MTTLTFDAKPLTTYRQDVVAWAKEQAELIRAGRFELLDLEHIADEIDDVGKSEQRELASRMVVLMTHLLKWQCQPERRSTSWTLTIREQRKGLLRRLKNTPSLKNELSNTDWLEDVWTDVLTMTTKETGIGELPETCPWVMTDILSTDWLPADK